MYATLRDKNTYVRVKPSEHDTEHEVLVVVRRINEGDLDASSDDRHSSSFDRQTNETKNDAIGIFETSLGFPQDTNECGRSEDVRNNR